MNKPLLYYTSFTPGDESYLLDLQKNYGKSLEKLTRREQMFLLYSISSHLCCSETGYGYLRLEMINVAKEIQSRLKDVDLEGLCEALINQIRWGNHAETTTP